MRFSSTMIFAGALVAGLSLPASAQMYPLSPTPNMPTNLDCSNPQNALEYYCNNRNQFDSSGRFQGAPAADVGTTGSVTTARPAARAQAPARIDCGNPQNATTAYCMNRAPTRR